MNDRLYGLGDRYIDPKYWRDYAVCREVGPDLFFSVEGERGRKKELRTMNAIKICLGCGVRVFCGNAGRNEKYGVWGGEDMEEKEKQIILEQKHESS